MFFMKKQIIFFLCVLITGTAFCSSCGGNIAKKREAHIIRLGPMPVVIYNSSKVYRHIWIFEGFDDIKINRDPQTGKMVLDRVPILEFTVKPCFDVNRHTYTVIYLPKNSSFRIYEQAEVTVYKMPIGRPFSYGFKLDSDPYSRSYHPQTPNMSTTILCAHYIGLPYIDPYNNSQSNHLTIKIDANTFISGGINAIIKFMRRKNR